MIPTWLHALATIYVPLSIAAALLVGGDILIGQRRQAMGIMEAVWPLTMLYWGPVGLFFYFRFGRAQPKPGHAHAHAHAHHHHDTPMPQATFKGATHCGAGCALGDFLGDWIAFAAGFSLFGSEFAGKVLLGFVLAYLFGVAFQYLAVAPMRKLSLTEGLIAAVKIDTLSLLAYEVGMFAAMGARQALLPQLHPTDWAYWLTMQAAMIIGFATTFPVNWWLIRSGVKERM